MVQSLVFSVPPAQHTGSPEDTIRNEIKKLLSFRWDFRVSLSSTSTKRNTAFNEQKELPSSKLGTGVEQPYLSFQQGKIRSVRRLRAQQKNFIGSRKSTAPDDTLAGAAFP